MPSLSWNEIRQRAIAFSHNCSYATDERVTFADLDDPLYMPAPLPGATQNLERAVDRCY